jgi:hypothetical protein
VRLLHRPGGDVGDMGNVGRTVPQVQHEISFTPSERGGGGRRYGHPKCRHARAAHRRPVGGCCRGRSDRQQMAREVGSLHVIATRVSWRHGICPEILHHCSVTIA